MSSVSGRAVLGQFGLPPALGPQLPAGESELAGGWRASIWIGNLLWAAA
jgi:hypothetical protein